MPKHIYLALAIHNHQPVGNFDFVFAEAYEKAYRPMVDILERHPTIKLALHYSGPLRDWLLANRPELFARVATLVARGQVEIMTGGYYEPILAVIPDADKLGQMRKLTKAVRDDFGYEATGAWLAERVWEPHLAKPLAEAGVEYTVVDDTHFKYVGLDDADLFGYYVTEEQGFRLKIYGTSKYLRYTIPWRPVDELIEWLRAQASQSYSKVAVMGDDGEKFGLWPGTYEHVWGGVNGLETDKRIEKVGWMEEFFVALEENADWVETITLSEHARRFPALGRIYLPTASYDEMTEWALPAQLSGDIVELKHRLQAQKQDDILRFIRGGFWRHFLAKYTETNNLHKKMLWVSAKVNEALSDENLVDSSLINSLLIARDHLWAGQCNCPYWHGVFGGIYLPHIRIANYQHLITAENLVDAATHRQSDWVEVATTDFDCDSNDELLVSGEAMNLYFDLARGGTLFEWDWRAKMFNLVSTMTRRPEGYHRMLSTVKRQTAEGVKTIHDIVQLKETGLDQVLFYDWYRRVSLIDHFLDPAVSLDEFYRAQYAERGDFVDQPYRHDVAAVDDEWLVNLNREGHVWQNSAFLPLRLEKRVHIRGGCLTLAIIYVLTNTSDRPVQSIFGVEFNFGLLAGHSPDAYYRIPGVVLDDPHLDSKGELASVTELVLVYQGLGLEIDLAFSRPTKLWRFPIETISSSESGFERVYQSSCLLPHWNLNLAPGETWQVELRFTLREPSP